MMLFPLHLLLIISSCYCITISASAAAVNFESKDYSLLSEALAKVVSEVIIEFAVTLNVNSINGDHESNDFRDSFVKEITKNPVILARQQMVEGIEGLGVRGPRRTCIVPIRSFADFMKFYSLLNDDQFVTRGYYIFVLTNGRFKEIKKVFALLWDSQFYNINVIYESSNKSLKVETFFPFSSFRSCFNAQPTIINEYRGDSFTHDIKDFFPNKMMNLKQCDVRVATSNTSVPYVFMKTMLNGERRLFGRDYDFIQTLAQTMNFRINFTYVGNDGYLFPNGSAGGSFLWLLNKDADMALADYWLKSSRLKYFDASTSYISEKVVFVLPRGTDLSSIEKLLYPLTFSVWIMLFACFVVGYIVIFIIKLQSKTVQNFVFGRRVRYPYLNMWIGLVGNLQHRLPGRNFSRFILTLYLLFCLIIRTAYQGKMYNFMQSNKKHSEPQTLNEMIEKEYKITVLNIYLDLVYERTRMAKIDIKPLTLQLPEWAKQIEGDEKNAILLPHTMIYYNLIDNSTLNLLICREIFLTIPTVIYTTKNFYLLNAINDKIETFNAAGLIDYWHSSAFIKKQINLDDTKQPKVLTTKHLSGIFEVWVAGCVISSLIFLIECAIAMWKKIRENHA